ncbi:AAA family ATPase [bacterium]|nr:AAA family ATPase [bacterium]
MIKNKGEKMNTNMEIKIFFEKLYQFESGGESIRLNKTSISHEMKKEVIILFKNNFSNELKKYKFNKLDDEEILIFLKIFAYNIYNFMPIKIADLFKFKMREEIYKISYLEKDNLLIKNKIIIVSHDGGVSFKVNQEILNAILGTKMIQPTERRMLFNIPTEKAQLLIKKTSDVDFENDLILNKNTRRKIIQGLTIYKNFNVIKKKWNGAGILDELRRVVFLFHGDPGTGKTYTAYGIANYLNVPLYYVNIAGTQSKWVGDNEKFIKRIFEEFASKKKGILFFDEADALFGRRIKGATSPVGAMHNRVLNIMLQEVEKTNNPLILTTNFSMNFDKAFERRINYKIEFKKPDQEMRKLLWSKKLPKDVPLSKNISIDKLSQYELTGAEIESVCLNALRNTAYRIASTKDIKLKMDDLMEEIRMVLDFNSNNKTVGFVKN